MAQKTINLGTAELTGDGETLRSAFSKANDNFTELYAGAGSGIQNLVEDTTPQLGGNLDMNGFEIVTTNGGHIRLDPDTTGGVGIGNVTNAATLLHLQQSAPIITLQRLDNTLSQGISWTGQAGTEAASIKLDGTGGTTNTLIMSAFDGSSVTERLRVMAAVGEGIKVTGDIEANKIKTTSGNTDIILETHGTGDVLLKGDKVGIGIVNQPDTTLHLKDTNSVITLQRTADANTPGLSFQNSNGNVRGVIKLDGTSGTSNEIFMETYDGSSQAERFRVGHTGVTIAGTLNGHTIPGGTGTLALTSDITGSGISNVVEDTTPQLGGNLDGQAFNITTTGKILYSNLYATEGDLPNATTYHGMFAHVHATGAGYFAHGGNWIKLANDSQLSSYQTTAGLNSAIDTHLNQSNPTSGHVLSWNGSDYAWVANSGGGSQNLFSTVASSGQNNIVADGTTDTLYIEAGSGISIATDQNTDTLTITATGGGGLANVVDDTTPQLGGTLDLNSKAITSTGNITVDVSGSSLGISIGNASTSGSTVSIGAEVNNTSVNMNGVTEFNARAIFNRGVHEKFLTLTGATGVVAHNVQNGHVFYHTGAAANWTANFTNLSLAQEDATNIAIIVNQGNTGYIPSAVQIGGAAQTIVWNGNSTPSATDNGTDVFSFTILNDGGTYVVLGQMVSFGGV